MAYKPDKHGRDHCPGGEDPIPCLGSSADRVIEYLWAGPKLRWFLNPPGFSNAKHFQTWVEDLTLPFGGYLSNSTGTEDDVCIFAAPLGPRWSVWHIDMFYGRGPDYGDYQIDIATKTMARLPEGFGLLDGGIYDTGLFRYDIGATEEALSGPYPPGVWDTSIAEPDGTGQDTWITNGSYHLNGFTSGSEILTNIAAEVGFSLRITGAYGDNLTSIVDDEVSPHTGRSMDSGDGVMYYFRVRMVEGDGSGFKGRIQAFRLSRAFENDGTLI